VLLTVVECSPQQTGVPKAGGLSIATGRLNRMFQVLPDQEDGIFIGDMLSDGIVVVEMDPSPTATPEAKPKILLSPVDGNGEDTTM